MKAMQTETRTTARYYVQWLDITGQFGTPGAWMTTGDDGYLQHAGYETVGQARRDGVRECFKYSGTSDKWPAYRIVQRLTVETVIPN